MTIKEKKENGKAYPGIEFGSARIKSVLIYDRFTTAASGDCTAEKAASEV